MRAGLDALLAAEQVAHRDEPPPTRPWVLHQGWRDLLFAHWPVPAGALRNLVPAPLAIDVYDGEVWVGVVPFRMVDVHSRIAGRMLRLPDFPELNVRTYVRWQGRAGVFFFSLDAASRLAVLGARTLFGLPYHHARMSLDTEGDAFVYRCRRSGSPSAELFARYAPIGPPLHPRSGTLEHFLTERYRLFVVRRGGVRAVEIQHPPWPLQPATCEFTHNTMGAAAGIRLPDRAPLLHFAARQDVLTWAPRFA